MTETYIVRYLDDTQDVISDIKYTQTDKECFYFVGNTTNGSYSLVAIIPIKNVKSVIKKETSCNNN